MAAPNIYENGAGGTVGDSIATESPLHFCNGGFIWYVSSNGGSDAAATGGALDGGRRRESPLATLAQAVTNASDGDLVICLANHAEAIASSLTIGKKITIASEGQGSSAACFTANAAINMFDVTVANVRFRNLYFPASTVAPTARIRVGAAGVVIKDCYFECGTNDTNRAVQYITGAAQCRVEGTTFASTAATPKNAVEVVNAMAGLDLVNVIFDGSSFGWSSYAFQGTAAVTNLFWEAVDLINNSDWHATTGTTGFGAFRNRSGSALIRNDS
jgi:hypothetical protein